ncbi:MAG: cytochrome c biogenesis protein CcsA [Bacteroidota bacterium]
MQHTIFGHIGHLSIIISFVTALVVAFGYYKAAQSDILAIENKWLKFARIYFYVHFVAVIGIICTLFYITAKHYFEYYYVWNYSSRSLPTEYILSSFWHGQEGSFLLWIFWDAILGLILIKLSGRKWEAPVMAIFALVQAFLCSMILGVVIPGIDLKIGSTPFLLLKEAMPDLPVWQMNANFIPEDGKGMNPLLQNYWMVIHPPTLFLGFATTLVPFAYLMAGFWKKRYSEWIKPSLAWSLVSALILGVGILMGAYWAYETLNFGGYWNWDPVENAVYVPWLVMVGAIHTQIANRNSGTAIKASAILVIAQFILILYSTFLTRSGILGDASVHSFTDLGLSGQLLIYLFTFILLSVFLCWLHWKHLPKDEKELNTYNKEFWIFIGATVICLAAFQVIFTTSIPVYNKIMEAFGFVSNLAMPADQIAHYSKFQLWAFALIACLTGLGQYVWWGRIKKSGWIKSLTNPLIIALVLTALVVNFEKVYNISYAILLFCSLFALVANAFIIFNIFKGNYKVSGGAITHIGVAFMLLGILFSSGYSKVVSLNNSGMAISNKDEAFTKDDNKENKENIALWQNKPQKMDKYTLTYRGMRLEGRDLPEYLKPNQVEIIEGDFHAIALEDISQKGKNYYKKGDTLAIFDENRYYEIDFRDESGKITTLFPRFQLNKQMGNVSSPALKHSLKSDLFTYVALAPNLEEREWTKTEEKKVAVRDTFFLNDYVAILEGAQQITEVPGISLGPNDAAVKANLKIIGPDFVEYNLEPKYIIKEGMVAMPPVENEELGLRIRFTNIDPKTGVFSFGVNTTQRDFVVLKAIEKPLINLLWIGTALLVIGVLMAAARRYREFWLVK